MQTHNHMQTASLVRAVLVRMNAAALVEVIGRATLDELTGPRLADLSVLSRCGSGSARGCLCTRGALGFAGFGT